MQIANSISSNDSKSINQKVNVNILKKVLLNYSQLQEILEDYNT